MERNFWRQPKSEGANRRNGYGATLVYPPEEGNLAGLPFGGQLAEAESWITLLKIGYAFGPYTVSGSHAETKDNSSTIAAAAAGIEFKTQASPSDNDDIAINSTRTVTVSAGRRIRAIMRFKQSSAANLGLRFGVTTTGGTEFFTANPTDGIYFAKAKNSAALTFEVVENGNASVQTANFRTVPRGTAAAYSLTDDTDVVIGFEVYLNTSGTTRGSVWINGVETELSATVATALYTLLNTTAPTLLGHLGTRVNSTTQRTMTVQYAWIGIERSA